MKNLFIVLGLSVCLAACNNGNNQKAVPGGFVINGTINGMDSGWVYLLHNDSTPAASTDSAKVKNHAFSFTGKVKEPTMYYLTSSMPLTLNMLMFFVDDTVMQITAYKDSMNKSVVSGSSTEQQYEAFQKAIKPFNMQSKKLIMLYRVAERNKNQATEDSIDKVYDEMEKDENNVIVSFVQANPNSIISGWAIQTKLTSDPNLPLLTKAYAALTPAVQNGTYGVKIKKAIEIAQRLAIGSQAPDFSEKDSAGNAVSLSSFKGKYVLVDFWASWCHPCREENPNVVKAYEQFKNKNFTIISVSCDDNKAAWMKAVRDDGLSWTQVCVLKNKNSAADEYGINSIPSNFLISPYGKILAHNLRGQALPDTLAVVLNKK